MVATNFWNQNSRAFKGFQGYFSSFSRTLGSWIQGYSRTFSNYRCIFKDFKEPHSPVFQHRRRRRHGLPWLKKILNLGAVQWLKMKDFGMSISQIWIWYARFFVRMTIPKFKDIQGSTRKMSPLSSIFKNFKDVFRNSKISMVFKGCGNHD
jgi:hypothetical protein